MNAITINLGTFTNEKWGKWEDEKGTHGAYLDLYDDELNVVPSRQWMPKSELIKTVNKFVQQQRPFIVRSYQGYKDYDLGDRTVRWTDGDVPTRQEIVEKYVLAKLRTFGQDEQPPLEPIDVEGLAKLIDYEAVAKDDTQPAVVFDTQPHYIPFQHSLQDKPALPITGEILDELLKRKEAANVHFFSCAARGKCAWEFLTSLFYAVVAPFMLIYVGFTGGDDWRHCGWRVLDIAIVVPLSPFGFTAKAIQNLLGAIIHPAIALAAYEYEDEY